MEFDVLIVGAGPAGLAAAITLGRYGIPTLLIEMRSQRAPIPRANLASTRTMELMRSWGLEDEIRAGGVEVDVLQWIGPSLAEIDAGNVHEVGVPTRAQAAVMSPTGPVVVAQDHLEPVLERHLRSYPSVTFVSGVGVTGLADDSGFAVDSDGVRVTLDDGRVVRARYVIGADGARSTVRERLGIAMRTEEDLAGLLSAEFRAPLWEVLGKHRYALYYTTRASVIFLPVGANDRWRMAFEIGPADDALAAYPPERIEKEIRVASGLPNLPVHVGRIGTFAFAAGIAEKFRAGRVFLIGDAAHRVTPRGGTGMNIAMHDGFDLAWKLAFVLNGWTGEALLDSYERERRPVVEHNLARSTDPNGSNRTASQGLDVDLGGRLKHVWLGPNRSTVDSLGPGLTRFTVDGTGMAARIPTTMIRLDPIAARSLGVPYGGSLVVRPDGHPWADIPQPC